MEMAVMRVHKTGNYTIMSNYHFKEKEMSLKAKGLLSLMLSLPDDWDYSINGLATLSKDGRDSVMGALKELERFGYLTRTRITDEKGKFKGYDYDIFEEPQKDLPNTENPYTEKPNTGNPTQLNTNKNNSEGINTLLNKDKKEINIDKRADGSFDINVGRANSFTKELIKCHYIDEDDLFLLVYNKLFSDLVDEYGFEIVRACLWYFIKRLDNGKAFDQFGNEIESRYNYLKTALTNEAHKLQNREEVDPFSIEAIAQTLELFGRELMPKEESKPNSAITEDDNEWDNKPDAIDVCR